MSDVPEGYRMSEVGVIPEDWEVKSLENIGLFKKGKNIPKKDLISEGVPCVLYGEIYTEYNFTSNKLNSFIPHTIAQQSTSINKGDILFAGSGETAEEIGKCFTYLGDEKACAGGDINIFCPLNDDSTFLGYLLNSVQVNKQKSNLGQGSSVVHIYSSSLKTILIPLPPLPEQQAIASALSDVDALITALDQLITKKRNIKQGAMQQLLTGKKRLPGFSGEWEVKKVGDICDILKGNGLSKGKLTPSGQNKCILYGELFTTYSEVIQKAVCRTNSNEGKLSKNGDILMPGSTTTVGIDLATASALLEDNILLGGDINILRKLNGYHDSVFLSYYLTHVKKYDIAQITQGITIIHLYGRNLIDLTIELPHFPEQQAIAQILTDMDTEIEALKQKRNKYKAIKQGMMQELLTGKTRLL